MPSCPCVRVIVVTSVLVMRRTSRARIAMYDVSIVQNETSHFLLCLRVLASVSAGCALCVATACGVFSCFLITDMRVFPE